MNRRRFLQMSALAAVLAPRAPAEPSERSAEGFKVDAHADRHADELLIMGGRFDCKVSGRDTGGDLCIFDTTRGAKGGPVLHRHRAQDEWFYVIRGKFLVQVGDKRVTLGPGDSAFAPRRVPHAFAKVSEEEGQMLVLFQPAGSMEDFFHQMQKLGPKIPTYREPEMQKLWAEHGMEVVGPPLTF